MLRTLRPDVKNAGASPNQEELGVRVLRLNTIYRVTGPAATRAVRRPDPCAADRPAASQGRGRSRTPPSRPPKPPFPPTVSPSAPSPPGRPASVDPNRASFLRYILLHQLRRRPFMALAAALSSIWPGPHGPNSHTGHAFIEQDPEETRDI